MEANNLQLLGEFYRHKRESLNPQDFGLSKSRRSRTPGLRREDVAYLSGISAVWYSKIERGKVQGISFMTLQTLNQTLKLSAPEIDYVQQLLYQDKTQELLPPCMEKSPRAQRVVDLLCPLPAVIMNSYLDIIYANRAFTALCGVDVNALPAAERNHIYLTIKSKPWQQYLNLTSREKIRAKMQKYAAVLRRNQAARPNDPRMKQLIDYLSSLSPLFIEAWQENQVANVERYSLFHHQALQETLPFSTQILAMTSANIVVYHPKKDSDYAKLVALNTRATTP